ncbi:MAG: hypothetical protein ACRCX2_36350 [Paraclostridium sp.]
MVNNKIISSSFGLEGLDATAGRRGNAQEVSAVAIASSGWSLETENIVASLIKSAIAPVNDGGTMDRVQKGKAMANIASNAMQKLVAKYGSESTVFATLPKEVKSVCEVPAKSYFELKTKFSAAGTENEKFKIKYKMTQAKIALESALWSVFSGIHQLQQHRVAANGMGLEGVAAYGKLGAVLAPSNGRYKAGMEAAGLESTSVSTYSDQIFIPKVSAFNSWLNIASVIMPKVQKTKTVLNEICEIPVSTKHMIALEKDQDGNVVREYKREELYAKMDMAETAPNLDTMRTRDLTLGTAELNRHIDLHKDVISSIGGKFLAYNEHVGPQLTIQSLKIEGMAEPIVGEIHDIRAGLANGPALGQLDTKGKVIPFCPNKAKPNEVYNLVFDWDVQNSRIFFTFTKTSADMPEIENITLRANLRDVEQTLKSKLAFKIQEERTVLKAPEIDRYVLPILPDEMEYLADRGSANHLNKLVELTSEFTQHKKESRWIKEYRQMKNLLKVAKFDALGNSVPGVLYSEQNIALNTLSEVRKDESIAYHLGNNLNIIKDKFAKDANSTHEVQLSMFTGTLNLNVISQCLEVITGDVDEDSDAKFLGISQSDRVRAVTLGNSKNSPIQSIVVGTDKSDFDAKGRTEAGDLIPTDEIEYKYEIIPTYKDENIQTTMFLETPTKVISGSEVRANEYPLIPAMIIHEGYKFNVLRPAAGEITITGVGYRSTVN